jgi:hypothetical protein
MGRVRGDTEAIASSTNLCGMDFGRLMAKGEASIGRDELRRGVFIRTMGCPPQRLKPHSKHGGYRSAEALRHPKAVNRRPSAPQNGDPLRHPKAASHYGTKKNW